MLVNNTIAASDKSVWYFSYDRQTTAWSKQDDFFLTNYSYAAVVAYFNGNAISVSCIRDLDGAAPFMVSIDDIPEGPFSTTASSDSEVGPGIAFSKTGLDPTLTHEIIIRKVPDPTIDSPITNLKFHSLVVTRDDTVRATGAASNYVPIGPKDIVVDDKHPYLRYTTAWKSSGLWGTYGTRNSTLLQTSKADQPVSLIFQGTAIQVVSLLWWDGGNFTITLDDVQSGSLSQRTSDPAQLKPTVMFSAKDLDPSKAHVLSISGLPDDPGFVGRLSKTSSLNIDSFIITGGTPLDPDSVLPGTTFSNGRGSASASLPTGAIVGIVIGVIILLGLSAFLFLLLRRRRRRQHYDAMTTKDRPSSRDFDLDPRPYQDEAGLVSKVEQAVTPAAAETLRDVDPRVITPFVVPAGVPIPAPTGKIAMLNRNVLPPTGSTSSKSSRPALTSTVDTASPVFSGGPVASSHRSEGLYTTATSQGVNDQIEELRRELQMLRDRQDRTVDNTPPPVYQ